MPPCLSNSIINALVFFIPLRQNSTNVANFPIIAFHLYSLKIPARREIQLEAGAFLIIRRPSLPFVCVRYPLTQSETITSISFLPELAAYQSYQSFLAWSRSIISPALSALLSSNTFFTFSNSKFVGLQNKCRSHRLSLPKDTVQYSVRDHPIHHLHSTSKLFQTFTPFFNTTAIIVFMPQA
jgi:hypothetical protein